VQFGSFGLVIVTNNGPYKTFPEFLAYSKAHPGELNYATTGAAIKLAAADLAQRSGLSYTEVPYKGNPDTMVALMGNIAHFTYTTSANAVVAAKDGRIRILAVTSPTRMKELPDVPAVAEFVPGYQSGGWSVLVTSAKVARPVIDRWYQDM